MTPESIYARLEQVFPSWLVAHDFTAVDPWIEVKAEGLLELGRYLRDEPELRFDLLHCVTAVDYFEPDAKGVVGQPPSAVQNRPGQPGAAVPHAGSQPHLELIYHLSSTVNRHRLVLKACLPRWLGDAAGQLPEVPSLSRVWRTAEWHEREVFDLMGVRFQGHADLRRILCPEDWVGHPLRKDYSMPAEYHGIPTR